MGLNAYPCLPMPMRQVGKPPRPALKDGAPPSGQSLSSNLRAAKTSQGWWNRRAMADADVTPAAIADQAWQAHGAGTRPPRNGAAVSEGLPIKFWRDLGAVAPPDRLVRRLLGTATLALIYGEPGSGKTFL